MSVHNISDFNFKIRILQAINHLVLFLGIAALVFGIISLDYLWIGIASYVWFVLVGTTIGLHRYFSHRSFKTNRVWENFKTYFIAKYQDYKEEKNTIMSSTYKANQLIQSNTQYILN